MKDYMKLVRRYKVTGPIIFLLFLQTTLTTTQTLTSEFFKQALNSLGTSQLSTAVTKYVIAFIVILILTKIKWTVSTYTRENFAEKYRNDMYRKVVNIPIKELNKFSISDLTVAVEYAFDVAENCVMIPNDIVIIIAVTISSFIVMMMNDWILTLFIVGLSIPGILSFNYLKNRANTYAEEKVKAKKLLNSRVSRLEGYQTIKSFGREEIEVSEYEKISRNFKNISIQKKLHTQNASFAFNIFSSIIEVFVLIYVAYTFNGNVVESMSKGILFFSLSNQILYPLTELPRMMEIISEFHSHLKSNNNILELQEEEDGEIELTEFNSSIEFKNVGFSYTKDSTTLKDINITIPKGKRVGIYGPSGGGKSTFINLLNRFYKIDEGEILIDGININNISKNSLRKIVGNVNQEIFLFSDMSIKDNIKYGIKCSDEMVVEAAKLANAHEFIIRTPDGYNSMIGNNGVMLSGGERQRIALARLFLLDPEILILDEATSKLDNESEVLIKESLDLLCKNKTIISIAHRFTTIEDSDILIGIKGHTIFESGTNHQIKMYGQLWNSLQK